MYRSFAVRGFITGLALFALAATPTPPAHASVTYHLTYGAKDLGMWNTLVVAKSAHGLYDGTSFDSSNGPGFATVTLSRAQRAEDRTGLYGSLPPPNIRLVVHAVVKGKSAGDTICPLSQVSEFGNDGNPGTGTETITFACTVVTRTK